MAATVTTDKKNVLRDKRAQGIAAMGLVNREGDRFRVTTPSLRGRRASYEVWRDESGKVRCSCLEFEEQSADDTSFRCEHILAVKHALLNKNTEAVTKAAAQVAAPAEGVAGAKAETSNTPTNENQTATEKPADEQPRAEESVDPAPRRLAPRFGREQQAAPETPEVSTGLSLAEHNTQEEHTEMTKQRQANAKTAVLEPENDLDFVTAEEHEAMTGQESAPVVPLSFTNTLRTLKQPVDSRLVKTREGWTDRNGNRHMVEYVEWHTVADILDRVAPTWSHSVRGIVQIGDMVAVTCAITIDGVTREGVGTGTADNETGIKKAEHDALKRAAIKFGIARELYQRESDAIEAQGSGPQQGDLPRDPLAKSMADLVTPKQLGMIRALAREAGVDVEEECQSVLRCRTEELSKRAASSFIDHLKGLQNAAGGMRRAS